MCHSTSPRQMGGRTSVLHWAAVDSNTRAGNFRETTLPLLQGELPILCDPLLLAATQISRSGKALASGETTLPLLQGGLPILCDPLLLAATQISRGGKTLSCSDLQGALPLALEQSSLLSSLPGLLNPRKHWQHRVALFAVMLW